MTPDDRSYTPTHEWISVTDGIATVGITDLAQEQLGDLTFIELPRIGSMVQAGQECMTLESVKAASDVYAPVSGTVVEVNTAVQADPGLVNRDPFGEGWLYRLRDVNPEDCKGLLDGASYRSNAAS